MTARIGWVRVAAPVAVGLIGLLLWILVVDVLEAAPRMLPSPVAILTEFVTRWNIIGPDMAITGTNALVGLIAGTVLGVLFAALAASLRPVDGMLAPLVAALAVIPIVALTPIFNTMFGASSQFGRQAVAAIAAFVPVFVNVLRGLRQTRPVHRDVLRASAPRSQFGRQAVAAIAAFVPVFVNVLRGLRQTRPVHRDVLRASAASGSQTFRMLTLPTALPYLMTGIRIAASLAVISALVAEYFGGPADGIGTAIATYAKSGRAALAWAFVLGGILIGLVFFLVTSLLERLVAPRAK